MPITLAELFAGIDCHGLETEHQAIVIRSIVTDSRQANPGSLFVALGGQNTHGILFTADALARGAVAILASEAPLNSLGTRLNHMAWITTSHPRTILSELAQRLYGFPAKRLRLHGVTGTNGKTTTVYMLNHILKSVDSSTAIWSTNSVEGIPDPFRPHMTTPDAPELHRFLKDAIDHGARDVIMEVSSHALAIGRIDGLRFETGAITNITPDHLDFHGSYANYREAKASFMRYISPTGFTALNADDGEVVKLAKNAPVSVTLFGFAENADVRAQILELGIGFSRWEWWRNGQYQAEVRLPIPGQHNIANALAALSMATHLGIDPEQASRSLQAFVPAPRRLETMQIGDVTIISDVAMNRASYDAVMQSVELMGRPFVVVNAIRGNRGVRINEDIANILADWNDRLGFAPVVLTLSQSILSRLTVDYRVRSEEVEAFLVAADKRKMALTLYDELPDAIAKASARLAPGHILLLLGTFGMDDGLDLVKSQILRLR